MRRQLVRTRSGATLTSTPVATISNCEAIRRISTRIPTAPLRARSGALSFVTSDIRDFRDAVVRRRMLGTIRRIREGDVPKPQKRVWPADIECQSGLPLPT